MTQQAQKQHKVTMNDGPFRAPRIHKGAGGWEKPPLGGCHTAARDRTDGPEK